MSKLISFLKKEPMLTVSVLAAVIALCITPPTKRLLSDIDWRTLGTLFMMLTVLEGFKQENIFNPLLRLAGRIGSMAGLSLFLVFAVFFSSMFVTNDVSLIIFVPLTILLFRAGRKERYILPVISMQNIAAVRGSLLTPFGSPQNLFLFDVAVHPLYVPDLDHLRRAADPVRADALPQGSAAGHRDRAHGKHHAVGARPPRAADRISRSVCAGARGDRHPDGVLVRRRGRGAARRPDRGPEDIAENRLRASADLLMLFRVFFFDRRE